MKTVLFVLAAQSAAAFPFVAHVPGVRKDLLPNSSGQVVERDTCPSNPNHQGAVPINSKYPYLGAVNGTRGTGKGGIQVPAPGDTAHYFTPPGPLDIRGPCPGLNVMANHNFLSHDGITTYNELVDAQQNVYNVGFDLANLLASFGVGLDGDPFTKKLSIGCDANSRTNGEPVAFGDEGGLNTHNKFEADASLTRNDYFMGNGDDYSLNTTLFQHMADTCKDNFDLNNLALYRYMRYTEARAQNPEFFFGPGSLLLYGAATFLYGAFPSYGLKGQPTLDVQKSFFGVSGQSGNFTANHAEQLPANWFNSVESYDNGAIGQQLLEMYFLYPVQFGANVGAVNNFNGMNYSSYIQNGYLSQQTAENIMCMIYQIPTSGIPTSLSYVYQLPADSLAFVLKNIAPGYANLGCPSPLYPTNLPIVDGSASS